MNCPVAPAGSSRAVRGRIGVTELALLAAHERDCPDCQKERESARALLAARLPLTRSRALVRALGRAIVAARAGTAMVSAGFTRGRAVLSPAFTTAGLASAKALESCRLGGAWLKLSTKPLARVPDATAAVARATIRLMRGAHAALLDRGGTAAASITVAAGRASERGIGLLVRVARARSILTPETGFLLRVCAGIAGVGILALTLIFAWPRQWLDSPRPDRTSTRPSDAPRPSNQGPTGSVAAVQPRAEPEAPEVVLAPPPVPRPTAPPEKREARKTTRLPSPGPPPESAAPARSPAPATEREQARPDTPDPSAAIDWLLKGTGGTSRRDIGGQ